MISLKCLASNGEIDGSNTPCSMRVILDTGFWIPDAGHWTLDLKGTFYVAYPESSSCLALAPQQQGPETSVKILSDGESY
jgi:hypothetical protein